MKQVDSEDACIKAAEDRFELIIKNLAPNIIGAIKDGALTESQRQDPKIAAAAAAWDAVLLAMNGVIVSKDRPIHIP
ncbi:MAG: hypothetical protein JWL88_427 [Parcubacteria group bacterium]|nr:hypothetical protein [Parcubacteria group bacterium]